jgi:uncharacterized membrane protein
MRIATAARTRDCNPVLDTVSAYIIEWLSLLGRWVHLIVGIAWIGSSFYFIWLDNHLRPPEDADLARKGVGGELWAVHGGGFYNSHKYRVAPGQLPAHLHWFYWEAYSTFLSGMFLMCLLYYGQAQIYLIDPSVAALSKPVAIVIAVSFLVGGWFVYDGLCRTPLARNGAAFGAVLVVMWSAAAWGLCQLFSGRGAFIQFGAMLGTIMVANVFFVIIPGQREMVRAKQEGREPDPQHGIRGKLRSTHNTYFTLPVLFTMVSNHYAITFGGPYNWLVLIAISLAGVLIRVYFVSRHKAHERGGHTSPVPAVLGVITLAAIAFVLAPRTGEQRNAQPDGTNAPGIAAAATDGAQQFARVQAIVTQRCVPCHAARPTQPGFVAPPGNVLLDSPEHLRIRAAQIHQQVATRAMPIGNLTGITEEERATMLAWAEHGAAH